MTLAILYICTGRYNLFFEDFYNSCEKYLLPNVQKTYYVWTDNDQLSNGKANVNIYYKKCAGFPADSLFRFEMFLQAEEELKTLVEYCVKRNGDSVSSRNTLSHGGRSFFLKFL